MSNKKVARALRVSQLDTAELDASAVRLLSGQLQNCFKHKIYGYDLMLVEPHLRTAMYVLLLYSTLWKNGQTIGQKLLRLRTIHGISQIGSTLENLYFGRYGVDKTFEFPSKRRMLFLHGILALKFWLDASKSLGRLWFTKLEFMHGFTKLMESAYDLLSLLNFVVFLRYGHFHTLVNRIVGLRSVYVDPNPLKRNISFHIMKREILWQGFAETGVFFLSLINISKLRRKCSEFVLKQTKSDEQAIFDSCGYCKQVPVMPYIGSCKIHAYCYYCVSTALSSDEGTKCPMCGAVIETILPMECRAISLS